MRKIRKDLKTLEDQGAGRIVDYKKYNYKEILASVWYIPSYGLIGFRHNVTDDIS